MHSRRTSDFQSVLLGAFAELQKTPIIFVKSVCPSVGMQ